MPLGIIMHALQAAYGHNTFYLSGRAAQLTGDIATMQLSWICSTYIHRYGCILLHSYFMTLALPVLERELTR